MEPGRQRELIALGREAIERFLVSGESSVVEAPGVNGEIGEGVFVTLRFRRQLRGCIGLIKPGIVVPAAIMHCAVAAAVDPRFTPLRSSELSETVLEISVLGPTRAISGPGDFEPGAEGLIVGLGSKKGVLLPQVAREEGWGALRFLEETCVKAGLPPDAWLTGARIEAFNAEVFREEDLGSGNPIT